MTPVLDGRHLIGFPGEGVVRRTAPEDVRDLDFVSVDSETRAYSRKDRTSFTYLLERSKNFINRSFEGSFFLSS